MALVRNPGTFLADLVNPQVLADVIQKKLTDLVRFAPLAVIDNTLVGRPGDTLSLPSYQYIGDATVVAEGADIPVAQLQASPVTATVHKIGKAVEITDEAVLSGHGDPIGEALRQLAQSIASGVDNEMLTVLRGITGTMAYQFTGTTPTADDIANALELFGEDMDGDKVILISPKTYTGIRKANGWIPGTELGAEAIIRGTVGMIHGCQIVVSNKLAKNGNTDSNDAYIVKPGALRTITKRDVLVETDRDILAKYTVLSADKHYVNYLYDASKAIKLSL